MRTDNTINPNSRMFRAADNFIYAAGAVLALVLAYGFKLF